MFFFPVALQGTISETTGTFLYLVNLTTLLFFPSATVLTLTSITPGEMA
jgi:hypothetical protein